MTALTSAAGWEGEARPAAEQLELGQALRDEGVWVPSTDPGTHAHPVALWLAAEAVAA